MTTIAYDHKNQQIACDSRTTADGFICSDSAIKYRVMVGSGDVWFYYGVAADVDIFIANFKHNEEIKKNVSCGALLVRKGIAYGISNYDGVYKQSILSYNEGFGSGACYALSAIDLGLSAKKAVEYAMTRDCYTGGKIHVYDIKKGKFVK